MVHLFTMVAPLDQIDSLGAGAGGSDAAPPGVPRGAPSRVVIVETLDQLNALKAAPTPCIIDYFAEWCGPCKAIAPKYAQLSSEFPRVVFAKVNIEDVQVDDVAALPTFQLWRAGVRIGESTGADITKVRSLAAMAFS